MLGGRLDKSLFAHFQAGRACCGIDHGDAAATGALQHQAGLKGRGSILDRNEFRPFDRVGAVDENDALAVFETGLDQRCRRRPGNDYGGIGAIVERLPQCRFNAFRFARGVEHHHHLTDGLQPSRDDFDDGSLEGGLHAGHDKADNSGAMPEQAARKVIDVISQLVGRREHLGPRLRRYARAICEGS